jgi:predicted signal transduction protein with EAL and GGDEF domain
MVTTVRWVGPARTVMFIILTAVLMGSFRTLGWLPLIPLVVAAVLSSYLYRNLDRRARPEYWAAGGWLVTQGSLGVGIAITGGPHSAAMPWLGIAIVSLVARFSLRGMFAGMVFLFLMLVGLTFGVDPQGVANQPSLFLLPAGLLVSIWVFAAALMRSDLDHRDHDKLTSLPNQAMFAEGVRLALARRARRGGTISVLAVDLDGFGLANESLGPRAGDELLRQAGARVARAAQSAELVARRSADEFLILLCDLHDDYASGGSPKWGAPKPAPEDVARSVQAALADPLHAGDEDVYLGACVGIGVLADEEPSDADAASAERLLAHAQHALSGARSAGPGSLMVYDHAQPGSVARLSLITRLRRAVDREEFIVYYQPTVNLHTGEVLGVEALLRWQDPGRGLIAPGEFIGVAEETGLILPIGSWMIDEVCRQAREWDRLGLDLEVAFNLSPRQLWQPDLLRNILHSVERSGVRPDRLVVEITESSALRDPAGATLLFARMSQHGLRLAIDDFGVGLSSLNRLREIPAEVLKIDRTFVSDISRSPGGAVMVQTIIQLAHNLGMRPHAEGVEDESERRFLLENGCDLGQGFLFSKPRPAEEIPGVYVRSRRVGMIPMSATAATPSVLPAVPLARTPARS